MHVCRVGAEAAPTPLATERRPPRPETASPPPPRTKVPLESTAAAPAAPAEAARDSQAGDAPGRAAASAAAGEVARARADAAELARQLAAEESPPAGAPAPPHTDGPAAGVTVAARKALGAAVTPAAAATPHAMGGVAACSTDVEAHAAPKPPPAFAAGKMSAGVAVRLPAAKPSGGKPGVTSRAGGKAGTLAQKHRQPTKTKAGAPAKVFSAGKTSGPGSRARSPSPLQPVTNQGR